MIKQLLKPISKTILSLGNNRECPICKWTGINFLAYGSGTKKRLDSQCPRCGSAERHRLAFYIASQMTELDFSDILHIAPEPCITSFLQKKATKYLSIDLYGTAMQQMDICKLDLQDSTFSFIWCSHVLEHVTDDELAINELYRVLKPGGTAMIQVPMWSEQTYENSEFNSPEERFKHFYQKDHVRLYGLDIIDRFEKAGFVSRILRSQEFGPGPVHKHALSYISTNEVFLFHKNA